MTAYFDCPHCKEHIAKKNPRSPARTAKWVHADGRIGMFLQPEGWCDLCGKKYNTDDYKPRTDGVKKPKVKKEKKNVNAGDKGEVKDAVLGDVNGDGKVDREDLSIVHKEYAKNKKKD